MKIIETDNFGRDYPCEKELNVRPVNAEHARAIAEALNSAYHSMASRWWIVVEDDYVLDDKPFEP